MCKRGLWHACIGKRVASYEGALHCHLYIPVSSLFVYNHMNMQKELRGELYIYTIIIMSFINII